MRTFPRELASLREIVSEKGMQLRQLTFEALKAYAAPVDEVAVGARPATIGVIVQPARNGGIRVVVQGLMKAQLLPGSNVALDGFYKDPDGRVSIMPEHEFNEFG